MQSDRKAKHRKKLITQARDFRKAKADLDKMTDELTGHQVNKLQLERGGVAKLRGKDAHTARMKNRRKTKQYDKLEFDYKNEVIRNTKLIGGKTK